MRYITKPIFIIVTALILMMLSIQADAARVLTLAEIRSLALEYNRTYLTSLEDIRQAESDITTARSSALPNLTLSAGYNRNLKLGSFFVNADGQDPIEFKTGFKNDFTAALTARQSIWKGGKVFNAYKVAKMYKKYALSGSNTVKAEVINSVEQLYFAALLANSNLEVIKKAHEANSKNLDVIQKLYNQGLASEFELLRAKVEKSNLEPQILEAESEVRLSKKRLLSFLGLPLDDEIYLEEPTDDTTADNTALRDMLVAAHKNRPEMNQAELLVDITDKAISIAQADYYPQLEALSTYSWSSQSDKFTLSDNKVESWTAGVQLTLPIFNGGETKGAVNNYRTENNRAQLALSELKDAISLETEEAYDRYHQALETLAIQKNTIAQAEEGLRIANLRYESGVGTQFEVLSAIAALTQARNAKAQALFTLRKAKSDLRKVTTLEIN